MFAATENCVLRSRKGLSNAGEARRLPVTLISIPGSAIDGPSCPHLFIFDLRDAGLTTKSRRQTASARTFTLLKELLCLNAV